MDLCASPSHLRSVNLVFSICLYPVLCRILTILHPPCNETKRQLYALALVWFPVLNFFNYLYYTDAGSTLFVLLTYMLVKEKCYRLAGLVSVLQKFSRYYTRSKPRLIFCVGCDSGNDVSADKYHLGLFLCCNCCNRYLVERKEISRYSLQGAYRS